MSTRSQFRLCKKATRSLSTSHYLGECTALASSADGNREQETEKSQMTLSTEQQQRLQGGVVAAARWHLYWHDALAVRQSCVMHWTALRPSAMAVATSLCPLNFPALPPLHYCALPLPVAGRGVWMLFLALQSLQTSKLKASARLSPCTLFASCHPRSPQLAAL